MDDIFLESFKKGLEEKDSKLTKLYSILEAFSPFEINVSLETLFEYYRNIYSKSEPRAEGGPGSHIENQILEKYEKIAGKEAAEVIIGNEILVDILKELGQNKISGESVLRCIVNERIQKTTTRDRVIAIARSIQFETIANAMQVIENSVGRLMAHLEKLEGAIKKLKVTLMATEENDEKIRNLITSDEFAQMIAEKIVDASDTVHSSTTINESKLDLATPIISHSREMLPLKIIESANAHSKK